VGENLSACFVAARPKAKMKGGEIPKIRKGKNRKRKDNRRKRKEKKRREK